MLKPAARLPIVLYGTALCALVGNVMAPWIDVTQFEHLKASGDLPSPKGVALALIRLIQKEDVSLAELGKLSRADPAFVGRLLKAANALSRQRRRPVGSVHDALLVLGLPAVRTLALGFSLIGEHGQGPCQGFDYARYWSHCVLYALAMQALSLQIRCAAPEEAFSLGLLARVGELALATLYPKEFSGVLQQMAEAPEGSVFLLEQRAFAITHRELTSSMLENWGLPPVFCEPVYFSETPEEAHYPQGSREFMLVHVLHVARCVADVCLGGALERPSLMGRLLGAGAVLAIEPAMLTDLCAELLEQWTEWCQLLELETVSLLPLAGGGSVPETAPVVSIPPPPVAVQAQPAQRLSLNIPQHSQALRVVVVDDDPGTRLLVRRVLEGVGHQVREAADGLEGMQAALEFRPQMMIVDWMMPHMGGLELSRALRQTKIGREIYIIIMTGQEDEECLIEAFENGVDDFMHKPIRGRVLAARLRAGQRVIRLQQELDRDRDEIRHFASELAVSNRRLQEVALTDALTGFPNRRYALERLQQEWSASVRSRRPLSVMVIDVDKFKHYNDTYGHDFGDTVLRQASAGIKAALRTQDVLARMGGDEFLVLCADTDLKAALVCAERVRSSVAGIRLRAGEVEMKVSLSIGVACRVGDMQDPAALIKRADEGLYRAKELGRDRAETSQQEGCAAPLPAS